MTEAVHVFSLLGRMEERNRTIILIRHSRRPSLQNIPYELRPEVELTAEGILMARQFGEALRGVVNDGRVFLLSTPAKRCRMTAEAVIEGIFQSGSPDVSIMSDPEIPDPIVDLDKFREQREQYGWHGLIRRWLEKRIDTGVLSDPAEYSRSLISLLLNCSYMMSGDMLVAVAHDITLFPVIHTYFNRTLTTIGYLNGIVLKGDECLTDIGFEEKIVSFPTGH